jgi:hypothetical protein
MESKIVRDGSRLLSELDSQESEDQDLCFPPETNDVVIDIMKYAKDYEIGY